MTARRVTWVCSVCKGQNVSCDATVTWSVDKQEWEGTPNGDGDFCEDCDADNRLQEVQLSPLCSVCEDTLVMSTGSELDCCQCCDAGKAKLEAARSAGMVTHFKIMQAEQDRDSARQLVSRAINVLLDVKVAIEEDDTDEAIRLIEEATQ